MAPSVVQRCSMIPWRVMRFVGSLTKMRERSCFAAGDTLTLEGYVTFAFLIALLTSNVQEPWKKGEKDPQSLD